MKMGRRRLARVDEGIQTLHHELGAVEADEGLAWRSQRQHGGSGVQLHLWRRRPWRLTLLLTSSLTQVRWHQSTGSLGREAQAATRNEKSRRRNHIQDHAEAVGGEPGSLIHLDSLAPAGMVTSLILDEEGANFPGLVPSYPWPRTGGES